MAEPNKDFSLGKFVATISRLDGMLHYVKPVERRRRLYTAYEKALINSINPTSPVFWLVARSYLDEVAEPPKDCSTDIADEWLRLVGELTRQLNPTEEIVVPELRDRMALPKHTQRRRDRLRNWHSKRKNANLLKS